MPLLSTTSTNRGHRGVVSKGLTATIPKTAQTHTLCLKRQVLNCVWAGVPLGRFQKGAPYKFLGMH